MNEKSLREEIVFYIRGKYGTEIEYPWYRFPNYCIFRHSDNNKWYGIIMDIPYKKLGLEKEGATDVLNVKIDNGMLRECLLSQPGITKGYHMASENWLSVLLDGTVAIEKIQDLIDESFVATSKKSKREKYREPKDWIVPANPLYYDIVHAFDNGEVIDWKQCAGIIKNDIVFIYVAKPVSAILYKCKVIETNIPYNYVSNELVIKQLMKIKLLKRYGETEFTFETLKTEYGITAIRGPRSVPNSLSYALNR